MRTRRDNIDEASMTRVPRFRGHSASMCVPTYTSRACVPTFRPTFRTSQVTGNVFSLACHHWRSQHLNSPTLRTVTVRRSMISPSSCKLSLALAARPNLSVRTLCPTTSHRLATTGISLKRIPPHRNSICSLLVRWSTSQDPSLFKAFSNLLCCGTRKRRASLCPNILLPCNFRVATRLRTLMSFCKIKQGTSEKVKESPN